VEYVTDEERVEELKKWWKENGTSVLLGVGLGLAVLFGWRWWGNYQENQMVQASNLYVQVESAIQGSKTEQAQAFADKLYEQFPGQTYAVYAALELGKYYLEAGKHEQANQSLQWAYDHADSTAVRQLAAVRLARSLAAASKPDQALAVLNSIQPGEYASLVEELRGDILLQQGKQTEAREAYLKAKAAVGADQRPGPALQLKIDDLAVAK
jgi:predicted negative regulator of RcsB-dependent stress response